MHVEESLQISEQRDCNNCQLLSDEIRRLKKRLNTLVTKTKRLKERLCKNDEELAAQHKTKIVTKTKQIGTVVIL